MPLVIPPTGTNWLVTMTNSSGGLSGRTSIAIGTSYTDALTQTDVDRIANLFRDGLAPLLDTSWLVGPVHAIENNGEELRVWDNTGTEAGTGGSAQLGVTPAVAVVVSKVTGILGRAHRGRVYMPGLKEADVDESGTITGSVVNTYQSAFDALKTALIADTAVDSLALFHSEGTLAAGTIDEIQSFRVRTIVGTMRPRQRR